MMKALALALALPLMGQVPKSYHGSSNGWSPFHTDKVLHFTAGVAIGFPAYFASRRVGNNQPWIDSLFWALLAGAIKENYDRHHGGRPEWADVAYTGLGGFTIGYTIYRTDKAYSYAGIPKNAFQELATEKVTP